jgi:hypothetical protein
VSGGLPPTPTILHEDTTMATSSILGGEQSAPRAEGRDIDRLGPSDSSDSGADVQGERSMATEADNPGEIGATPAHRDSASDALGTGERGAAAGADVREGADILPDRIIDSPDEDAQAEIDALSVDDDEEGEGEDEDEDEA